MLYMQGSANINKQCMFYSCNNHYLASKKGKFSNILLKLGSITKINHCTTIYSGILCQELLNVS